MSGLSVAMSGLRVLKVLGSLPDMFKMFNSIIGPFHRTMADTLLRSSLAGIRLLSLIRSDLTFITLLVLINQHDRS